MGLRYIKTLAKNLQLLEESKQNTCATGLKLENSKSVLYDVAVIAIAIVLNTRKLLN